MCSHLTEFMYSSSFRASAVILLTVASGFIGVHAQATPATGPVDGNPKPGYRKQLVHHFERNEGQAGPEIEFLARGRGYSLLLQPTGAMLQVRTTQHNAGSELPAKAPARVATTRVRMKLVGGNPQASGDALEALPGRVNYLTGNRRGWRTGIQTFGRVRYQEVYPGIDVVYHGREGLLEYDFVVAPGADFRSIRLGFEGLSGAFGEQPLRVDRDGSLVLETEHGEIRKPRPVVYQDIGGKRHSVRGDYKLHQNGEDSLPEVGFELGAYDRQVPVVIDPVIVYSTYLGGTRAENYLSSDLRLSSIAADDQGCAYVAGTTTSTDFPVTAGAYQASYAGPAKFDGQDDQHGDAFVCKLSADGSQIIYATYLGGFGSEAAHDIAIDAAGCAYITGFTASSDFPVVNAFQSQKRGPSDVYVTKLNATGSDLIFSTYLGGTGDESGRCITVSPFGEVGVAGTVTSFDFPLQNPVQDNGGLGNVDMFVTRFSADGTQLGFSTYLGGNVGVDEPSGVAVDPAGSLYICGTTSGVESTFPTHNAIQREYAGFSDFVVAKFSRTGELYYSTFLGGSNTDYGRGIAVDLQGNAYLTGYISSKDFPRAEEHHTSFGFGPRNACVVKLNPEGNALVYTTFIAANLGIDIGLRKDDEEYTVYVVGDTDRKYPVKTEMPPNFQRGTFVARLNPNGTEIISTSFILAAAQAIAVDRIGDLYLTGDVYLKNFETANAIQPLPARRTNRRIPSPEITDAFVAKITSAFAIGGKLVVSPAAVNFGTIPAGTTSVTKKVKLRNTGRGILVVKVGWTPAPFTGPPTGPEVELIPGVPREVELTFTPPAKGSYAGKLSITSTDLRKRVATVSLKGRGK